MNEGHLDESDSSTRVVEGHLGGSGENISINVSDLDSSWTGNSSRCDLVGILHVVPGDSIGAGKDSCVEVGGGGLGGVKPEAHDVGVDDVDTSCVSQGGNCSILTSTSNFIMSNTGISEYLTPSTCARICSI